jgi:hypothetical protein
VSDKHRIFYEGKESFREVYCSREDGLVCNDGECRDCWWDEWVMKNTDLREACYPEEVPNEDEVHEGKEDEGGAKYRRQKSMFSPTHSEGINGE